MTSLPKVTITPAAGGWLVTCDHCPSDETWHPRRPGADRAAHEHRASHARKDAD